MITVCNRTETAARVKHAFDHQAHPHRRAVRPGAGAAHRLEGAGQGRSHRRKPPRRWRLRTRTATTRKTSGPVERKLTKAEQAELLRQTVDTVGKAGQPGEKIQNVISVGMLSEGWDAKTVTHIMGLRAFSSASSCASRSWGAVCGAPPTR